MDINQANLTNLVGLWHKYGAVKVAAGGSPKMVSNHSWPHRCWLDLAQPNTMENTASEASFSAIEKRSMAPNIVPIWPVLTGTMATEHCEKLEQWLTTHGWHCQFEQSAMYLDLTQGNDQPQNYGSVSAAANKQHLTIKPVVTSDDLNNWVAIGSEAFGYQIDKAVIQPLVQDSSVELLLVVHGGNNVASALLYITDTIVGVHQVGVTQAAQGKGIARWLMEQLIERAAKGQASAVVLQASAAGKPLYDSLGFKTQFVIKNYQKSNVASGFVT